jgi:hypothetical protein
MSRRSLTNLLSEEELTPGQIWDWFEFHRTLIGEERGRVSQAVATGQNLQAPRYQLKTREELEAGFDFMLSELEWVAMLSLLSTAEATLRVDFVVRVRERRKDSVSRCFRSAYSRRGIEKIRLEEDILDCWRDHGACAGVKGAVSEFKGALTLRHWLAHGRWWRPRLGRADGYDPVDIFDICQQILTAAQ